MKIENDNKNEIVYVLTNPCMPGLIKIGKTTQKDVADRMKQLYSTGVPLPFECVYACKVADCSKVESMLHAILNSSRINSKREFFEANVDNVIPTLDYVSLENVTPEINNIVSKDVTVEEEKSTKRINSRRANFSFDILNIEIGEELEFCCDSYDGPTIIVTVKTNNKIELNGEIMSLSPAASKIFDECNLWTGGNTSHALQGPGYFSYKGQKLTNLRNELEGL